MTRDDMTAENRLELTAEEVAAGELAQERGLSLTGPDGLLRPFTKNASETALNEGTALRLGRKKNRAPSEPDSANVGNGTRS